MLRRSLSALVAVTLSAGVAREAWANPSDAPPPAASGPAAADADTPAALRSIARLATLQSISPSSLRKLPGVQLRLWQSEWMSEGLTGTDRLAGYFVSGAVEGTPVDGLVDYRVDGPKSAEEGRVTVSLVLGGGKLCVPSSSVEQLLKGLGYDQAEIPVVVSHGPDKGTYGYDYSKMSFPTIRTIVYRKGGHTCLGGLDFDHREKDDAADDEGRSFAFLNDKMDLGQAMQVLHDRGYVCDKKQARGLGPGETYIKCTAGVPQPPISGVASRMVLLSVNEQSGAVKLADMRDLPPAPPSRSR